MIFFMILVLNCWYQILQEILNFPTLIDQSMGLFDKLFGKKDKAQAAPTQDEIDLTKVFPRIKGLYDDETPDPQATGKAMEMEAKDTPIHEPIAKGLGLFYAIDNGNYYTLLQQKHLSSTITLKKLRIAAIENLIKETAEKTQIQGEPSDIVMLTNGGNYETAMILIDGMWDEMEHIFNDEVCIALPARDLLFIAGKNNTAGRERLRDTVQKVFDNKEMQGLLVRHIYTRENGTWVVVETA
jgi:hypothetical protein